ncbi:MAG: hypothetical protein NTY05_03310 [Rhodocyclales bacterium]|nr:hypothetical protein [Rhodocyclales bacterium]
MRIAAEPFVYFDDYQVHRILTNNPAEYLGLLHRQLADIARGDAQLELPPKQIFHDLPGDADFRVMPCVVRMNGTACKTVKIIGTNTLQEKIPDQITVGKAFVIDSGENFVSHIFEACLLSSARTGACAALATKLLAPVRSTLTVIGAGRVGYYATIYTASLGGVEAIRIADSDHARAVRTAALLTDQLSGLIVDAVSLENLPDADVAILATTSREPICRPPAWGAGLVISLGADTDNQRELTPEWVGSADIFVDTLDSARFGDLAAWQKAGLISADKLVDLFHVLRQSALPSASRPRVFISTGSALFDNLTISYILDQVARQELIVAATPPR